MWNTERSLRNEKVVAFVEGYDNYGTGRKGRSRNRKLSRTMAIILGVVVTLEIMIAGAMIFNIDIHGTDSIALVFAFMVLYFGVVAVLTDN